MMTPVLRPNGYLVVRAPHTLYRGADREPRDAVGHAYWDGRLHTSYRGPDREPWHAVGDAYRDGRLPPEIRDRYAQMRRENSYWWETVQSLSEAIDLAKYSEEASGTPWEVVGVFSPYLASLGRTACFDADAFEACGLDVISVGEWSLVRALAEAYPNSVELQSVLNEFGLVSKPDSVDFIVQRYWSSAQVEEIGQPTADRGIDAVVVFLRGAQQDPASQPLG